MQLEYERKKNSSKTLEITQEEEEAKTEKKVNVSVVTFLTFLTGKIWRETILERYFEFATVEAKRYGG